MEETKEKKLTNLDLLDLKALELQEQWVSTWQDFYVQELLVVMLDMSEILLKNLLSSKRLILSHSVFKEKAQDAATRLWVKIKKDAREDSYRVKSFRNRLYLDVIHVMFDKSYRVQREDVTIDLDKIDMNPFSLDIKVIRSMPKVYEDIDYQGLWDELISYPEGKRVILTLASNSYYKRAVLEIEKFMPRSWIYAHAKALMEVFNHTREARKK